MLLYLSNPDEEIKLKDESEKNTKYTKYDHVYFTAGDIYQFEEKRIRFISQRNDVPFSYVSAVSKFGPERIWSKYMNLHEDSVSNTFKYIFHKFKKGIFVQIINNQVKTFLPFSKYKFINEFHQLMEDKLEDMYPIFERSQTFEGRKFKKYTVSDVKEWYGNNGIFRFENPIKEADSGVMAIRHMFTELCSTCTVPDIEFFINKRDHPIIREDECEAYDKIYGDNTPLLSHSYDKYTPILSMCTKTKYADIPIPTWDDWGRVMVQEKKYFPKSCHKSFTFSTEWKDKIPTAIFRGATTGFGVTENDNVRIKASLMPTKMYQGYALLDAGITSINARPRFIRRGKIDTFSMELMNRITLVPFMDYEQQSKYKYILHLDGHTAAFRLSISMNMGSVVLIAQSGYKMWFSHLLVPYEHYVPVKHDLSDLLDVIMWCRDHDQECEKIAQNARVFYTAYLGKESILQYLNNTLWRLKYFGKDYTYTQSKSIPHILYERSLRLLNENFVYPIIIHDDDAAYQHLPKTRTYDKLVGMQYYLHNIHFNIKSNQTVNKTKRTRFDLHNNDIAKKVSPDKYETVNEAVIGMFCVNQLIRDVPNFMFTFGYHDSHVYLEYFPGAISFQEFLSSERCTITDLNCILQQLVLSIHIAQQQFLFMHCDLTPWNILIIQLKNPVRIDYKIDTSRTVTIHSSCIPVIIDYGKSRAVIKDHIVSSLIDIPYSPVLDVLTLTLRTIKCMLDRRLSKEELSYVFLLTRFFSDTDFNGKVSYSNVLSIRQFVSTACNLSYLLYSDKKDISNKTPMDLFSLLHTHKRDLIITPIRMRSFTPRFYLDMIIEGETKAIQNLQQAIITTPNNIHTNTLLDRLEKDLKRTYGINIHSDRCNKEINQKINIDIFIPLYSGPDNVFYIQKVHKSMYIYLSKLNEFIIDDVPECINELNHSDIQMNAFDIKTYMDHVSRIKTFLYIYEKMYE